jgi:hypothetical protein
MKLLTPTLCLIALAGCATHGKFVSKMNGFVGQPESVIVGTYGPPQSSYVMNDGAKVLQYTRGGTVMLPGATTSRPVTTNTTGNYTLNQGLNQSTGSYSSQSTTYVQQQAPMTPLNLSCTVNFTVDKAGTVKSWQASGNHCVAD